MKNSVYFMRQNAPLQLRILDLGQGGYSLTVHSSNDQDVNNVSLPIKAGTLEKRIQTIQNAFNDIVSMVGNRISL